MHTRSIHTVGRSKLSVAQKRIKRTDQEWFDLITECRTSELKVKVWCEQHGITAKALYYHTRQLRQKEYTIPQKSATDLHQEKQEVVCLDVPEVLFPDRSRMPAPLTDESRAAICRSFHGIHMEVTNYAGKEVISNLLKALLGSC